MNRYDLAMRRVVSGWWQSILFGVIHHFAVASEDPRTSAVGTADILREFLSLHLANGGKCHGSKSASHVRMAVWVNAARPLRVDLRRSRVTRKRLAAFDQLRSLAVARKRSFE